MENNNSVSLLQYIEDTNFVMLSCQNMWIFVSRGALVFPKSCHYMFNKVTVLYYTEVHLMHNIVMQRGDKNAV